MPHAILGVLGLAERNPGTYLGNGVYLTRRFPPGAAA
jgi:hypothetical protein